MRKSEMHCSFCKDKVKIELYESYDEVPDEWKNDIEFVRSAVKSAANVRRRGILLNSHRSTNHQAEMEQHRQEWAQTVKTVLIPFVDAMIKQVEKEKES